jgi:hypothetical protein
LPCWQVRRNGLAAGGDEKGAKMNHLWSFFWQPHTSGVKLITILPMLWHIPYASALRQ